MAISVFDPTSQPVHKVNDINFTSREIDVISYIINGRGVKKIAHSLSIAPNTVEKHVQNIMLKLRCNSREYIIDFVEKSKEFPLIKEHYQNLCIQSEFQKALQEISKTLTKEVHAYFLDENPQVSKQNIFFKKLQSDLKVAGINLSKTDITAKTALAKSCFVLGLLETIDNLLPLIEKLQESNKNLVLILQEQDAESLLPANFKDRASIIKAQQDTSYYSFFFELLKVFLPHIDINEIASEFEKYQQAALSGRNILGIQPEKTKEEQHAENKVSASQHSAHKVFKGPRKWIALALIGFSVVTWITHSFMSPSLKMQSALLLPHTANYLERSTLIEKIDKKYQDSRNSKDIKTVVLTGIGGAGKTTLARHYARSQKASVVWEINAETKESLIRSMDLLASALSHSDKEQKELRIIKNIKDRQNREEQLLYYVKKQLKANTGWFLIYDNVEAFNEIQSLFPLDSLIWGTGRVLITTRDHSIKNNSYLDSQNIIVIGELDAKDQLSFFIKILSDHTQENDQKIDSTGTKALLKHIPPFPLDTLIAAKYIKATGISYEKYLDRMTDQDQSFNTEQTALLKNINQYTQTRYNIITLALQHLINKNPEYKEILVLMCLLDSQKIHVELLSAFKKGADSLEFLQNLERQSLITIDSFYDNTFPTTISLHRSTQEIFLKYLIKELALNKDHPMIKEIMKSFQEHVTSISYDQNHEKIMQILPHIQNVLVHKDLVMGASLSSLISEYAHIYSFFLGDYLKSEELLNGSFKIISDLHLQGSAYHAQALGYQGYLKMGKGDYQERKLLEKSLSIYNSEHIKDYRKIAWTLDYLSYGYKFIGDYKTAKILIEQSLEIHEKHLDLNHIQAHFASGFLGVIYRHMGENEKAKDHLQKFVTYLEEHKGEYKPLEAYALKELGGAFSNLGLFDIAHEHFAHSIHLINEIYPKGHFALGWTLLFQGRAYRLAGDYAQAKKTFTHVLDIYQKHYGEDHLEVAKVLFHIAKVAFSENRLEEAEKLYTTALAVFEREKHSTRNGVFIDLSDLYLKKSDLIKDRDPQVSKTYKNKAIDFLRESLKITQESYPKESPVLKKSNQN